MLRKIALPVVALVAILILTSAPAKAGVGFGVTIGPPVNTYPAYPYDPYANSYYDPYAYPGYGNYYYAPAPAYVYPHYNYRGWGGGVRGHEFHEPARQAFRGGGHESRGSAAGGFRGGHRR